MSALSFLREMDNLALLRGPASKNNVTPAQFEGSGELKSEERDVIFASVFSGLETRFLSSLEVAAINEAQWNALSSSALVENPFYARSYIMSGMSTIDAERRLLAFSVWSSEGDLVGLFPMTTLFGFGNGAQNIYQFSGTPLVHRDHANEVIHIWLSAVRVGSLPFCIRIPDLQLNGPFYDSVCNSARRLGLSLEITNQYSRPQLTRRKANFETHLASVLSKSRRKELERCIRRLREKGVLRLERATSLDAVRSALETFLSMENAGWKGKSGTAFLASSEDTNFARAAFTGGRHGYRTIIDTLFLDDLPIAVSVNITSGRTLFTPKCTYLESFRNFAPGLVLEYLVIERFYDEPDFDRMDAGTTANGHVVQGLWNELVPMGTIFVGSTFGAAFAANLARAKAELKRKAKPLHDFVRGTHVRWIQNSAGGRLTNN